jgi:hypothetical protein
MVGAHSPERWIMCLQLPVVRKTSGSQAAVELPARADSPVVHSPAQSKAAWASSTESYIPKT